MSNYKKRALLTICFISLLLVGCSSKSTAPQSKTDKTINMMEINEISSMDSGNALDGGSFIAITQVFEGLYNLDENDQIIPGVATELPSISEDGLTYTIPLRQDAIWSNGEHVTANDFVYAWKRVIDPDFGSPSHFLLFDVKNAAAIFEGKKELDSLGIKALDDNILEITLEQPVAYFTSVLTFPTLFPINEAYAKKQGKDYAKDNKHLIYNGPYQLADWKPSNQTWQYKKNPDYWNAEQSNVDTVTIQVIKENNLAYNLYQTNELDRAVISGEFAKQEKKNPDYTTQLDSWVHTLEINQTEILKNKEVREAISLSIDREHIANTLLDNGSLPMYGLIPNQFVTHPESTEDFRKISGNSQTFDAKNGENIWNQIDNKPTELNLLVSDNEESKQIAEFIQSALQTNLKGLTISISSLPEKALLEKQESRDFDLLLTRQGPDFQDPTTFLNKYQSDAFDNTTHYRNEEFDELLEQAQAEATELDKRFNTLVQAEHTLLDDYGVIPIYQSANTALMRTDITGMIHHLFGPPNYYGKIIMK